MRVPVVVEELDGVAREAEPVAVGIPLERGAVADLRQLRLFDGDSDDADEVPAQITTTARWSDRSLRWVLVEALLSVEARGRRELWLREVSSADRQPAAEGRDGVTVDASPTTVVIDTGVVEAVVPRQGRALLTSLRMSSGEPVIHEAAGLVLRLTDQRLELHELALTSVDVSALGPLRATVTARGRLGPHLLATVRISLWSGRGLVRLEVTVRNPRPATHPGGTWDLGDEGSVLFEGLDLSAALASGGAEAALKWTDDATGPLRDVASGWIEAYQDSSGGPRWDFKTHLNREGRVPHVFRGYRVRSAQPGVHGDRASPTIWLSTPTVHLGATVKEFWQGFPKALEARGGELLLGLWPEQHNDLHELQGGEQKTHTLWLSVEEPANLGWAQSPLVVRSTPSHYARSGALPHLVPWRDDENEDLLELTQVAIDEEKGLERRRELIDQYGWRHFGDVFADHENVGNEGDEPRVSHYNNQYDGVYSALAQFARSGDARWLHLADTMARHVADIDIYHTELDRAAFSGGLFWHTDHYTDAVTATHRCYTKRSPQAQRGPYGGGPSAEHDYAAGLAMHYLMTGWQPSREGALSLATWVRAMDGPDDTLLGGLLPGSSGLATRTDDHSFHGPGRGAGNSVETLLDALSLTEDEAYLLKAEELIRRCVHPDDDRDAFHLLTNPEVRWSYTVMLLALVRYLEVKDERGELDERYAYAQSTLLSYARWMLEREELSSAKRDLLQIWTESWPAQDLRKGIVLMHAALHAGDDAERKRLHEHGEALFTEAQEELLSWDTRTLARPLVLVMRYGYIGSWLRQHPDAPSYPIVPPRDLGKPSGFVPWKGKPKALIRKLSALSRRAR